MSIRLETEDFRRLVDVLRNLSDFAGVRDRRRLVEAALEGSPRAGDVLGQLDLDGTPQQAAVTVVKRLADFGQVAYGRESLFVLLDYVLPFLPDEDAKWVAGLIPRYAADGTPVRSRPLADWRGREEPADVREKIIGENTLRHINFLEKALEAARAVVRLTVPTAAGAAYGSGFLVAPDLVMTNHHVIGTREQGERSEFTFGYQIDRAGAPGPIVTVGARAQGAFHTTAELDYTVVEIEGRPDFGTPLPLSRARMQRDARVNIIQHPGGHYKQISLQNNFVAYADARVVQYYTSTEPGSSGSPVFNDEFEVVAIHHSGGMLEEPGTGRRFLRNAGTAMGAILEDLRQAVPDVYSRLAQPF